MKRTQDQRNNEDGTREEGAEKGGTCITRRTFLHKSLLTGAAAARGGALELFVEVMGVTVRPAAEAGRPIPLPQPLESNP